MKIIDAHAHIYERLTGFGPKGEARAIGNGMVEWATGQREQFLLPEHGDFGFKTLKFEISEIYGLTGYHPDLTIDGPVFAPYIRKAVDMAGADHIAWGHGLSGYFPAVFLYGINRLYRKFRLFFRTRTKMDHGRNSPIYLSYLKTGGLFYV